MSRSDLWRQVKKLADELAEDRGIQYKGSSVASLQAKVNELEQMKTAKQQRDEEDRQRKKLYNRISLLAESYGVKKWVKYYSPIYKLTERLSELEEMKAEHDRANPIVMDRPKRAMITDENYQAMKERVKQKKARAAVEAEVQAQAANISDKVLLNRIQVNQLEATRHGIHTIYQVKPDYTYIGATEFLIKPLYTQILKDRLALFRNIKLQFTVSLLLQSTTLDENGTEVIEYRPYTIYTKAKPILNEDQIDTVIGELIEKVNEKIAEVFVNSGATYHSVQFFNIDAYRYRPLRGATYCLLPDWIVAKKACINVCNKDNQCFKWAILSALYPAAKDAQRVSKYEEYKDVLKFDGIEFPVKITDIKKFEKINEISINVFSHETNEKSFYPIHLTDNKKNVHVDLLLTNNHYVYIKDLSKLFGVTNHHKKFYCVRCLRGYTSEKLLDEHVEYCSQHDHVRTILPQEDEEGNVPIIQFKNYNNKFKVPFVIYADFENLTVPVNNDNNDDKKTIKYQKHMPCGVCFKVVSAYDDIKFDTYIYRGADCVDKFIEQLNEVQGKIYEKLYQNANIEKMVITREQQEDFNKAKDCYICEKKILDAANNKIRDHDHISGHYLGAACKSCNINRSTNRIKVPVVFHNLKGYDSHNILSKLGKYFSNINVIAKNTEQYSSFTAGIFRFIDSLQFMQSSLDKLVKNLNDDVKAFKNLKSEFNSLSNADFDLLLRKGVYPYDYMNSFDKFDEKRLPPLKEFYSKLEKCNIDKKEYDHAKNVWSTMKCQNMGDYHDLYLKTDVLLLADVFENFRKLCMNVFKLDPCHYISAPSLFWDAMLYKTSVKLDLITDADMYLMIERGIRGGISMITHRFAKSELDKPDCNENKSYIRYLDANNLYGLAMVQKLPVGCFNWVVDTSIFTADYIKAFNTKNDKNYILEVDLEYPQSLHDLHNDYPLAPEKRLVTNNELSNYAKDIKSKLGIGNNKTSKLICSFNDKQKYVVHMNNLKFYLEQGLVLKKVHRVISFFQDDFLRSYIELNTKLRSKAVNDFQKDFFKLANNAVFGKTMENVRERIDFKLIGNGLKKDMEYRANKFESYVNFQRSIIFNNDLKGVLMKKTSVKLDKPIMVGMSILDLSKLHMYGFHYNIMKPKYGDNIKLLMTDTDSLVYNIKTVDINDDFSKMNDLFDFSNYSKEHPLYNPNNKAVLGKFKDEMGGVEMDEFVGLRSKMYSCIADDEHIVKAKGIKKSVTKTIKHDRYKSVLFSDKLADKQQVETMNSIRSYKHEIYSIDITKTGLSAFDDKRYLLDDGVTSYAYGHYKISEVSNTMINANN